MTAILPQQRLLLEPLVMSGEIAVPTTTEAGILWKTLDECVARRWVTRTEISPGYFRVEITAIGRGALKG